MKRVRIYTVQWCGFCSRAKSILRAHNVAFEEISVDGDREARAWLRKASGQHTVPQIFFDDEPMGGCSDLEDLVARGDLDRRLDRASA